MNEERRNTPRVALTAEVRIRAAGSSGRGIACRIRDAGADGIRLRTAEPVDAGWHWIEILKSSGRAHAEPIELRVVHTATDGRGGQEIGCSFD